MTEEQPIPTPETTATVAVNEVPAAGLPRPYYEHGGIRIFHGNSLELIPILAGGGILNSDISLVFSSPPYGNQRKYTLDGFDWDKVVPVVFSKIPGTPQVLVNLGLFIENEEVSLYWMRLIEMMRLENWKLNGWYVWDQMHGLPGDWNGRLAPSHEWIFHFWKQRGKINKTVKCESWKEGSVFGKPGMRTKDGQTSPYTDRLRQPFRIPDSVIRIQRASLKDIREADSHPAVFPVQLPSFIISAFTKPNDMVLDPFMGSGTTLVAAKNLGRLAIGIEIEEKYAEIAARRLQQEVLVL